MADVLTPKQRALCMSKIRSKDTKPEVEVRKWLFAHGIRYRKNDVRLPGTPDIVIPKGRVIIFINGCFWHGHDGCKDFVIPKTRADWWIAKIQKTKERDTITVKILKENNWSVLILWECALKRSFDSTMEKTLETIITLRSQSIQATNKRGVKS